MWNRNCELFLNNIEDEQCDEPTCSKSRALMATSFARTRLSPAFIPPNSMTTSDHKTTMFLGETMAIDQYDDDLALTAYAWRHYLHLMTPLQKRVGVYSVPIVSDSPMEKARRLHQMLEERDGHVPDADVWDALQMDIRQFRTLAMKRLLAVARDELIINRCVFCKRLTRTPIARQCTWCGASWRE